MQQGCKFTGKILLAASLLVLIGCQAHRMAFKTDPSDATVKMLDQETGVYQEVGKTPYTLEGRSSLPAALQKSDIIAVVIEKDGFVTEHFIADLSSNPQIEVSSNLKPLTNLSGVFDSKIAATAEDMGRRVFAVYRQISSDNLQQAYTEAVKLSESYPQSSLAWDLRGSVEKLLNKDELAIASYKKSLQLNPENTETTQALAELEGKPR